MKKIHCFWTIWPLLFCETKIYNRLQKENLCVLPNQKEIEIRLTIHLFQNYCLKQLIWFEVLNVYMRYISFSHMISHFIAFFGAFHEELNTLSSTESIGIYCAAISTLSFDVICFENVSNLQTFLKNLFFGTRYSSIDQAATP